MYAIVNDRGKQYMVHEGDRLWIDRIDAEPGSSISFDQVMVVGGDSGVRVGRPTVDGASVSATVVAERKDKKIVVFKKKRRKMYRRKQGHRQRYTEIEVGTIA